MLTGGGAMSGRRGARERRHGRDKEVVRSGADEGIRVVRSEVEDSRAHV